MSDPTILVTGAAGFIGMHVARRLLDGGHRVSTIDDINGYYDVDLKRARLAELSKQPGFAFEQIDIADRSSVDRLFTELRPTLVIHLAAQPGIRYSLENPHSYAESNLVGFLNVLEGCRRSNVDHLVFASSSSVYGERDDMPYRESDRVDKPVSFYAATKCANEIMAHSYNHLYALPATGLRFFTVYGPWGRPDMAVYLFTKAIFEGRPIKLFNHGDTWRDYTFIDDIAEGVVRVATAGRPDVGAAPDTSYKIYNIGNGNPEHLGNLVSTLEEIIGKTAVTHELPAQPGDVSRTFADVSALKRDFGFSPSTPLREGLERFVAWYRRYHGV
ncbi:MAG: NAD-dependent epimerase/dehydratase family protein [Roseitalea sp.]|jgi:UDP-glucuronate 4-epimerase|nr:NAD-dependent epimerase/dehydratase family protein [Roseitalea sp.]MBO6741502.1 NAD-dependent epimerase/dehydratase family protein [Roseitalea sp.]